MTAIQVPRGTTSLIMTVFIRDTSTTDEIAGLTGLAHNTSGLTAYYARSSATGSTEITLADMTLGTFTSGGFKEIDATNMPGWYQFCPPNAAHATGADFTSYHLKGATNMEDVTIEVALQDALDVDAVLKTGISYRHTQDAANEGAGTVDVTITEAP